MSDIPNRQALETTLAALLMQAWEPFLILLPALDWTAFEQQTRAALALGGEQTYAEASAALFLGRSFDQSTLNGEAKAWADSHAESVAGEITETTRQRLDGIDKSDFDTSLAYGAALLLVFSSDRINMIAITETTAAVSAGQRYYADVLAEEGVETITLWHTAEDEAVCDVCEPLDGTGLEEWGDVSPSGPPAHPRCRCWLDIEYVS
jgi:Phage Mu protein F like protein